MTILKPFALVSGDLPDMRTPEQRRAYDRIEEKRWRWRVAQNQERRRARERRLVLPSRPITERW